MQSLRIASEPGHYSLRCPLARHPRGCRGSQQRDELHQRAESFGAGQPLGPDEAKHQHHSSSGQHGESSGAATSKSRSFDRKKLEGAVTTFERMRIPNRLTNIRPSSLAASSAPISGMPRKYFRSRYNNPNTNTQKIAPITRNRISLPDRFSVFPSGRALIDRNFGERT